MSGELIGALPAAELVPGDLMYLRVGDKVYTLHFFLNKCFVCHLVYLILVLLTALHHYTAAHLQKVDLSQPSWPNGGAGLSEGLLPPHT